ncbi:helix-turn-helix domain-containing protein [Streptomyces erythrochromogenes]|uniref:PucR family transcriptional regulator n=1 Tax=Streptomyces erythrochromogenes TaxID=285574 RepID=UPI00342F39AE
MGETGSAPGGAPESEELWPPPRDAVAALMRTVAERFLQGSPEIVDELLVASQRGTRYRAIVEDPVLAEGDRRMNKASLTHWLTSNIHSPGRRVPACVEPEVLAFARDLVRRGMHIDDLGSWRAAQRVAWRLWIDACFAATDDRDDLRDLLEVSAYSIATYVDDSIGELSARIDAERQDLARGAQAERHATVQLLLEGAPIKRARAEAQLGYALTGDHVAAIVWVDGIERAHRLEPAAERVMRACGASRRLTLVASTAALWLWMPADRTPPVSVIERELTDLPGVRVTLGRPAKDLEGFRRTHLDAAASQRVLARLGSVRAVARYEDVQLVSVLAADLAQAEQFVADTLGELATADTQLRETVLTYVNERFNASSTAERLFTHRNTVERRLARADQLLPLPLAQNAPSVAAALMLVQLREG